MPAEHLLDLGSVVTVAIQLKSLRSIVWAEVLERYAHTSELMQAIQRDLLARIKKALRPLTATAAIAMT